MTLGSPSGSGIDPKIVKDEAGVVGFNRYLAHRQPSIFTTTVSGNGEADFAQKGLQLSGGGTAGDTAAVSSGSIGTSSLRTVIDLTYSLDNSPPFGDDVEIGSVSNIVNNDQGAYLDLTTAEYHAGTSTASATLPSQFDATRLIVEINPIKNETVFKQFGGVSEEVTISEADFPQNYIARANSNGNFEQVNIINAKRVYTQ